MAAMLVELKQKNLINFYCTWHQHGRRITAFWIAKDWSQTINDNKLQKTETCWMVIILT